MCRGCKKWLADGGNSSAPPPPLAQVGNADDESTTASTALTESNAGSTDVSVLLANALALTGDNSNAHDFIADALSAIHSG